MICNHTIQKLAHLPQRLNNHKLTIDTLLYMSIILSNRVRNHIDSIVKEHLYTDDINGDEGKLLSRGITAICLAGLAGW